MKRVIWSAILKWIRWVLFWITRWVIGLCQGQQDNPREFRGWMCQEFSKGLWDPAAPLLFSWCAHHALIPPPPTLSMFQPKWRQENPISTELQPAPMYPNKGIYGAAPPELFLGMLWHFSCSVVLPALEGTEQLECSDGMGDLRRSHSPGCAWKWWLWEGGKAVGSWQLLLLPKAEGCVCVLLSQELPQFHVSLSFYLHCWFFLLETRSVALTIINYQNNKQIISSEQKFLLPAAILGKGSGEWIRRGNDLFLMSPVSAVKGLLWQCPAEPGLLFDSTE